MRLAAVAKAYDHGQAAAAKVPGNLTVVVAKPTNLKASKFHGNDEAEASPGGLEILRDQRGIFRAQTSAHHHGNIRSTVRPNPLHDGLQASGGALRGTPTLERARVSRSQRGRA